MRDRLLLSVGKREVCALAAQPRGELRRLAMELQNGTLSGHAKHFHILPGHAVAQPGADGLHSGFLGGKAGGQALCGIWLAHTVANLGGGEDTPEKSVAKTLHGGLNSLHFGDVNPCPYYHLRPHAKVSYRSGAA